MGFKVLLLLLGVIPTVVFAKNYYTAAVFEHRPRDNKNENESPDEVISANLKFYEKAAKLASQKGADIIVFNEYGIFPYNKNQKILKEFAEHVPNPEKVDFNPCVDGRKDIPILSTLSCMAKKNNIYLVANLLDKQPCDGSCDVHVKGCDQKCPDVGVLMYNTDVAFDRKGKLIARYHKMNLYFENLKTPEDPEYVTFTTEFGKFGLIVCFDSVFEDAKILAQDYNIDTLIFPTYWFDDVVPFNGVEWQQSWAFANNVNFLAANTQFPGNGSLGSGIYSKEHGALVYTYEPDDESKLLVANVPIGEKNADVPINPSITVIKADITQEKEETGDAFPIHAYVGSVGFPVDMHKDYRVYKSQTENYTLTKLETASGRFKVCNSEFCCFLEYELASDTSENIVSKDQYYFGAFSGLNNVKGYYHWCEETCLLLRCDPLNGEKCVMQNSGSETVFTSLKISADFTAERVHPTVTKNKFRLANKSEWKVYKKGSTTVLKFASRTNEPLLKAGLLGRCYKRDPPFIPYFKV